MYDIIISLLNHSCVYHLEMWQKTYLFVVIVLSAGKCSTVINSCPLKYVYLVTELAY